MSRLTRDGIAEPVSRDQILRHEERGQGNIHFYCSADHVQDWQPYPVDPYSCYMCDHTYLKVSVEWWSVTLLVLSPTGVPGITLLIYKADDGTRSVYLTDLLYYTWVKNLFSAYGRPIAGKSQHFKLHSPVLSTCYNHFIPIIVGVGRRGAW